MNLRSQPVTAMKKTKTPQRRKKKSGVSKVILNMIVSADGKLISPQDFPSTFNQKPIQHYQKQVRSKSVPLQALDASCLGNPRALARFLRHRPERSSGAILCENDPSAAGALFQAGLVTELHLVICPFIMGGRHRLGIAEIEGVVTLAQATLLRFKSWRRLGEARLVIYSAGCEVRGSSRSG